MSSQPVALPNLDYLKQKDPKLYETVKAIQATLAPASQPAPPPVTNVNFTSDGAGNFYGNWADSGPVKRGVNYFVEYSTDPNFISPPATTEDAGTGRAWHGSFPGQTLHFRVYSSYPNSGPNSPIVHGGQAPIAVVGGGSGIALLSSTGSGTAPASGQQPGSGFGRTPVRVSENS